jgi:trigger factor
MMVADIRRNKALAEVLQTASVTDASGNKVDLDALADDSEPIADEDVD